MSSHTSFLLLVGALAAVVQGQINHGVLPVSILVGNGTSVGPDGPWWSIQQAVDFPDQFMSLLPSLSNNALIINSSACSSTSAACPLPLPTLFAWTGADAVSGDNLTISAEHAASEWDINYAALLNMSGSGQFLSQRMTLHPDGNTAVADFLGVVVGLSNGYAATFPGGASYTLDSGFFSLYAGEADFTYTAVDGSPKTENRTLSDAYLSGYIPSTSYGLQVGSVYPNVSGSLVLGGYDSARCLTEPLISDSQSVTLTGISLNVSSGGYAYENASSIPIQNLLRANGSAVEKLEVYPDPGVPYLYLPQDTCDAIAAHLPVTYNADFNLYLWNTSSSSYTDIISSPHYLEFMFSGGSSGPSSTTINIPFALLNLTLGTPLVSSDTQYFPCSPWTPSSAGYYLGRSFLQGALLAQNWNTSTLFLAQAPGPGVTDTYIKTIAYTDTTISLAGSQPSWDSTWSSTLKALPANTNSTTSGTTSGTTSKSSTSSSLSGGAIAGIVIGVIALLALIAVLVFFVRRRGRRNQASQRTPEQEELRPYYGSSDAGALDKGPPQYYDHPGNETQMNRPKVAEMHSDGAVPMAEAPGHADPVEMEATQEAYELDSGSARFKHQELH